mmetsp:Transcript_136323/g.331387  ORF Transcript_136323/g.331387 Transcript_136323/m.331387 type:complete len:306 (+) Transcript_136323:838-1755(+)
MRLTSEILAACCTLVSSASRREACATAWLRSCSWRRSTRVPRARPADLRKGTEEASEFAAALRCSACTVWTASRNAWSSALSRGKSKPGTSSAPANTAGTAVGRSPLWAASSACLHSPAICSAHQLLSPARPSANCRTRLCSRPPRPSRRLAASSSTLDCASCLASATAPCSASPPPCPRPSSRRESSLRVASRAALSFSTSAMGARGSEGSTEAPGAARVFSEAAWRSSNCPQMASRRARKTLASVVRRSRSSTTLCASLLPLASKAWKTWSICVRPAASESARASTMHCFSLYSLAAAVLETS